MAEAIESVVLKLAIELENNRLERLDTRLPMQSIEEVQRRWNTAMDQMQQRANTLQLPSQSLGGAAGSFGGRASSSAGGSNIGGLIQRRDGGSQEAAQRLTEIESASERAAEASRRFNVEQGQTFLYMRRTSNEIDRMLERQSRWSQSTILQTQLTNAQGEALEKVSTASALAVVSYRLLTQVNGQHVNVLGEWEGSLTRGAIGLSVVTRNIGAGIKVANAFGVSVTAAGAALVALPLATAALGFRELAKAKAEAARQAEIGAALDEKIAAMNNARRQRELAAEKQYVDAIIGYRKRLYDTAVERSERAGDVRSRQIGLIDDPAQRLSELRDQNQTLTRGIGFSRTNLRQAESGQVIARQQGDQKAFLGYLEQEKRAREEIASLERQQTRNFESQLAVVGELTSQREADRQTLEGRREKENDFARRSQIDRAGSPLEFSEREDREFRAAQDRINSGPKDSELQSHQKSLKQTLARQFSEENAARDSLDDTVAQQAGLKDSIQTFTQSMVSIAQDLKSIVDQQNRRIEEIGNAVSHRSG